MAIHINHNILILVFSAQLSYIMTTLTQDDIAFLKWLDLPDNMHYWITDVKGDKVVTRDGRDKAFAEYKRIRQIRDCVLPPAKYIRSLESCQLFPGNE